MTLGIGSEVVEADDAPGLYVFGRAERHDTTVVALQSLDLAVSGGAARVVDEAADAASGAGVDDVEGLRRPRFLILHGVRVSSKAQDAFAGRTLSLSNDLPTVCGDNRTGWYGLRGEEQLAWSGLWRTSQRGKSSSATARFAQ